MTEHGVPPRPGGHAVPNPRLARIAAVAGGILIAVSAGWWWIGDFDLPEGASQRNAFVAYQLIVAVIPAVLTYAPFLWWRRTRFALAARIGGGLLGAFGLLTFVVGGLLWLVPASLLVASTLGRPSGHEAHEGSSREAPG